ncbi:MAG: carboxymuconolactone decarboxylase family protein [Rhodospirillaceae bacterium]|jgi:AhpD family alkylhydroperoxidase|nr:carboxymuconolactone decarboxylase family protein [Rhodospirillaceae bacterium]MBT4490771.1 carboxymuconolactone decarboxylase family protein [Rhodospirillaceae bacterium]MBT5191777.1 carboxymuconolactone decarboxylase family protein [Rhodospirillaceae bacterium]MBT5897293.1 carboxymuconolactone decarboxylase family protein [Rhodospirillaceae bacterium]MBT6426736.1 carboxymuconolactone decarboxylase family protein [Rhodospirillaceae bacterium]
MLDRIIEPVSLRDANPEARAVLDALRKSHAKVPVSFAYMAHQPLALEGFEQFYQSIIHDPRLDKKLRELAYLKTAMLAGCKLCIANHTASAKAVGLSQGQIAAMDDFDDSALFSELEKAILRYVEHVACQAGKSPEPLLRQLREGLGNDGVVLLTQVIGIANLFSRFNNALHTYSSEDYP